MRKSWNTLTGLVINQMGMELKLGDCFIFVNKRRNTCKILTAEDGGLVLYMKKLSSGVFKLPEYDPSTKSFNMEWRDLMVMVACAITFAERDLVVIPKVSISVNAKCNQADLMAYASSAFFKIGKKRKSIAQFLSLVFEAYFPGGEGFVYKKMPGAKETVK